jgi:hypothetical protein
MLYTSEDFIIDNPTISHTVAAKILKAHSQTLADYLPHATGHTDSTIDSADLVLDFLGY